MPPSWVTGGSVLAIEYGALDVAPGNFGQSGGSFKVTLPELPADVCLSMLPVILQSGVTTLSGSNGRTVYIEDDAPLTDRGAVTRAACAAQVDLTFEFV